MIFEKVHLERLWIKHETDELFSSEPVFDVAGDFLRRDLTGGFDSMWDEVLGHVRFEEVK